MRAIDSIRTSDKTGYYVEILRGNYILNYKNCHLSNFGVSKILGLSIKNYLL